MFGWLMNLLGFGGVKVLLWKYTEKLSKSNPVIDGAVLFKTKKDKQVLGLEVKVVEEYTWTDGEGEDKKTQTDTTVLGSIKFPERDPGVGYPLDLKPGADVEQTFSIDVAVNETLQSHGGGGMLGGLMKLGSSDKVEYYLIATASVKGQAFGGSAKEKLKVVE